MNIETKNSPFIPISITLTDKREVELLLSLLLLAKNKDNSDTNFYYMFRAHNNNTISKVFLSDEIDKYTEVFGKLLAELNRKLGR